MVHNGQMQPIVRQDDWKERPRGLPCGCIGNMSGSGPEADSYRNGRKGTARANDDVQSDDHHKNMAYS